MKKNIFILICICSIAFTACRKDEHSPIEHNTNPPGLLKNIVVTNMHGSAKISYTLPRDSDVLYVQADYEIRPGLTQEIKASFYNNYLITDGFGDTLPHKITLHVVNRSETKSAAMTVTVNPLTPPICTVTRSLVITPVFGGISISFNNPDSGSVNIITSTPDSTGKMAVIDQHPTSLKQDTFYIRGFDSTNRLFSFLVMDKYGNHCDTVTGYYKPLYEVALDKSLFKEVDLKGDIPYDPQWGLDMPHLWDNLIDDWNIFHTVVVDGQKFNWPVWFTFDLGVTRHLTRMTLWQRLGEWIYEQNNVVKFEVWGSANPAPDGSWDSSWHKLIEHTIVKPSGLPMGENNADDVAAAAAGEQMTMPATADPVRYIRIKVFSTWTMQAVNIAEVSFWGQD
jgi:hypothetical protein